MPTLTPFLWFPRPTSPSRSPTTASIFPDLVVHEMNRMGDDGPVFTATIEVFGQRLAMLNGGPVPFSFTEAISLFVGVDTQDEVDRLWDALIADGGAPGNCGWLKDRYGLSWQIVPAVLGRVLGGPDRERAQQAMDAMMQMTKLDAAALQAAYDR